MFIQRDFIEDSEDSDSFEGEEQADQLDAQVGSKFQPADLDQDFDPPADLYPPHNQKDDFQSGPRYQPEPRYQDRYQPPEDLRYQDRFQPPEEPRYQSRAFQPEEPRHQEHFQSEPRYQDRSFQPQEPRYQDGRQAYPEVPRYQGAPPRVSTPPRTYEDPVRPLKKAENEKVGFMRYDEPEVKPTTASARPGSSSAAMRQRMLEQQRNQYLSKKETYTVTSTTAVTRPPADPVLEQPYRSRNQPFASHIYEPSSSAKESGLAPVKPDKTMFAREEIEEVQLDESNAIKHAASKAVQNFNRQPEPLLEPPLTPRQDRPDPVQAAPIRVEEEPPPVMKKAPVAAQAPPKPAPVEPLPPQEPYRPPPVQEQYRPPPEEMKRPEPERPRRNIQQVLAEAMQDMHSFLNRPLPRDINLQCTIRRERGGFNRLYPKYFLFTSDTRAFLLAGKKRPGNKTSNYLMSMNEKELKTKSPAYMGKVRSNFMGTEFISYDKGLNPKRKAATMETFREELAVVMYQSNLLGAKGPRKMRVLLPAVNAEGERYRWKPSSKDLSMVNKYKAGDLTGMFDFFNKPPKWNERRR